jgi:hypothetical protein
MVETVFFGSSCNPVTPALLFKRPHFARTAKAAEHGSFELRRGKSSVVLQFVIYRVTK